MKMLRFTLACSLLLLAAVPSFAVTCQSCTAPTYPYCESTPDTGTRCRFTIDTCTEVLSGCIGFVGQAMPAVLAEWTVASVEVSRPGQPAKAVTAPATVASANLTHAASQQ